MIFSFPPAHAFTTRFFPARHDFMGLLHFISLFLFGLTDVLRPFGLMDVLRPFGLTDVLRPFDVYRRLIWYTLFNVKKTKK